MHWLEHLRLLMIAPLAIDGLLAQIRFALQNPSTPMEPAAAHDPFAAFGHAKPEDDEPHYMNLGGAAVVPVQGIITKQRMWRTGTTTIRTARALDLASMDSAVNGIVLYIDSPGGSAFGISDLAQAVRRCATKKSVTAYISDMGASAAYWIASQADRIIANQTAYVGSIGTYMVLDDYSKMFTDAGITTHVVRAGEFKGAGTQGEPISEKVLAKFQAEIDGLNQHFLAGVSAGRRMNMDAVRRVADGSVYIGADAKHVGLIDEVAGLETALNYASQQPALRLNVG